jgi:hypothetical protein
VYWHIISLLRPEHDKHADQDMVSLLEDIPSPVWFQHIYWVQQGVFRSCVPKSPKLSKFLRCIAETQIRQVNTYQQNGNLASI